MTVRFVLDESSWGSAEGSGVALERSIRSLVERLEIASERREPVCRHDSFYEAGAGNGFAIFDLLFDPDKARQIERDLAERLRLALDRTAVFEENELAAFDAEFQGSVQLAPGVSWAHARVGQAHAVAVLPLPLDAARRGPLDVRVLGIGREVHFVTTEQEHLNFFRAAVAIEDMGHEELERIAASAFPDIEWLPGVWHELRIHRKCFFGSHRPTLVGHLAVLNDDAAKLFHSQPGGSEVEAGLGARGVEASSENGKARSHSPSIADRTRSYDGQVLVFWWHTKIKRAEGRIHFLHVPKKPNSRRPDSGHIVIGIFKDHCVLPN